MSDLHLKLVYFDAKGRAELARWILAYGDIPYTDERIKTEDWPERKKEIVGGKVPVLEVNGKQLPQSLAIGRYVARLSGLMPEDPLEAATCDALIDSINDMAMSCTNDSQKVYEEQVYPKIIKPLLERLNNSLEGQEWYTSGKTTWADLYIGLAFSALREKRPQILDDFQNISRLVDRVLELPKIKEWNDKHPDK